MWLGMINPTLFSRLLKERCYGNRFSAVIGEIGIPYLFFCVRYSTADGTIVTWICALTPPMTLLRVVKI